MKVLIIVVVLSAIVLFFISRYAPVQHNPFRPLSLQDPIGIATSLKLSKIKKDDQACLDVLATGVQFSSVPDRETPEGCGFSNAVVLDQSTTPYSATLTMSCPLTAALFLWEKNVLLPAAELYLGSEISKILTYGTYSCRTISGSQRLSQHARANAIDISGVELSDGRVLSIASTWNDDSDESTFLAEIRDGACRLFSVVLSPDYNQAHHDHLHFDRGSGHICR